MDFTCGTGGIIKGKLLYLLGKILIINRVGVFRALIPPSSTAKIKVPKITVKNHGPNQISIIKVGRDFIRRDVEENDIHFKIGDTRERSMFFKNKIGTIGS